MLTVVYLVTGCGLLLFTWIAGVQWERYWAFDAHKAVLPVVEEDIIRVVGDIKDLSELAVDLEVLTRQAQFKADPVGELKRLRLRSKRGATADTVLNEAIARAKMRQDIHGDADIANFEPLDFPTHHTK